MSCQKKILCVGLCILDMIHVCNDYPKEDSDDYGLKGHSQRGGNAMNSSTVLRQLGANCEYLGVLSTSDAFRFLIDDCNKRNIEIKNCPRVEQDPPFSSIILGLKKGTRTIIRSNPNIPSLKYDDFKKINLNEYEWIHFEGLNPTETVKMMEHVNRYNSNHQDTQVVVSVEFEALDRQLLKLGNYATYVIMGKDFSKHLGWKDMKTAVYEYKKQIHNKKITVICPWGSMGSCVLDCRDEFSIAKALNVDKIIDSLGAGDTYCAAVLYALCCLNKCPKDAIQFGNNIAGEKLKFYGYDNISKIKHLYLKN